MNELDLYKVLEEITFQIDFHKDEPEIYCFSHFFWFDEFTTGFKDFFNSLDEGVFDIQLRQDYFVFKLKEICEHYEIDIMEIAKHLSFDNRY